MTSYAHIHDEILLEQILVMKHQEETSYNCEDYLQTGTSSSSRGSTRQNNEGLLPKIPLHLQQAAFEECAQFINMLVVDSTVTKNKHKTKTKDTSKDNKHHHHNINNNKNNIDTRDADDGKRSEPENSYGYFLQVPALAEAPDENILRRSPHKPNRSPSSVFDSLDDISNTGFNMKRMRGSNEIYSSTRSLSSLTSSQEDNSSYHCDNVRHLALWRRQMCKWAYRVVDAFGFYRVSVAVAFSILDRYICKIPCEKRSAISRRDFVIMTITCLYLSIKISEAKRKLSLYALLEMTRHYAYTADTIRDMEMTILETLQWKVNPPIASAFVSPLLKLIDSRLRQRISHNEQHGEHMDSKQLQHIFVNANRLVELSYIDGKLVSKYPSSVAIAAILLASSRFKNNPRQTQDHDVSIETYCNEIRDLLQIQINFNETKFAYKRLERIYLRHFY